MWIYKPLVSNRELEFYIAAYSPPAQTTLTSSLSHQTEIDMPSLSSSAACEEIGTPGGACDLEHMKDLIPRFIGVACLSEMPGSTSSSPEKGRPSATTTTPTPDDGSGSSSGGGGGGSSSRRRKRDRQLLCDRVCRVAFAPCEIGRGMLGPLPMCFFSEQSGGVSVGGVGQECVERFRTLLAEAPQREMAVLREMEPEGMC